MCGIVQTRNLNYNLRSQTDLIRARVNTSCFALNSLKIQKYGILFLMILSQLKTWTRLRKKNKKLGT